MADRGANAMKVFAPDGSMVATIPVVAPTSIVALPDNEVAVETLRSGRLVDVLDEQGKLVRGFGDPSDLEDEKGAKQFLNRGWLTGDPAGHIYFAFTYAADPTIRKYDRYGYSSYEIALSALEFAPQDKRHDYLKLDRHTEVPVTKPVINAIGVDPATQEIWTAIGNALLHFSSDGNRLQTYRTVTKDGARVEPKAILVEPDRLLLAADPIGIFEFVRPDKIPPVLERRQASLRENADSPEKSLAPPIINFSSAFFSPRGHATTDFPLVEKLCIRCGESTSSSFSFLLLAELRLGRIHSSHTISVGATALIRCRRTPGAYPQRRI